MWLKLTPVQRQPGAFTQLSANEKRQKTFREWCQIYVEGDWGQCVIVSPGLLSKYKQPSKSGTLWQLSMCALCMYSTWNYIMAHHCQLSTFDIIGCPCSAFLSEPWTCDLSVYNHRCFFHLWHSFVYLQICFKEFTDLFFLIFVQGVLYLEMSHLHTDCWSVHTDNTRTGQSPQMAILYYYPTYSATHTPADDISE